MKYSIALLVVLLSAPFSYGNADAQYRRAENLRHERVLLPPSAPDRSLMVVTDYGMFWDGEVPLFIRVTYDDRRTKREVDYTEIYDLGGNLVLIAWTDRFGIYQVAMDEVLLSEQSDLYERRLVLVTTGAPA
jgi:hypothetical protein